MSEEHIEAPPTPETPTLKPVPHWSDGLEPDLKGHLQSKGWDKLEIDRAFAAALKAHREAEHYIGVPEAERLRMPRPDARPDDIKAFWRRLGVPEKEDGYDFSAVKHKTGEPMDQKVVEFLRKTAIEVNLPVASASRFAQALVDMADATDEEASIAQKNRLSLQKGELERNWGANANFNMDLARRGASLIGLTPEQFAGLEELEGYAGAMETLRKLAVANGEDRIFTGSDPEGRTLGNMSADEAIAQRRNLLNDKDWGNRWMKGGVKEGDEMTRLLDIIVRAGRSKDM